MKYHEVSDAMNEGRKIRLKDWKNKGSYWYKKDGDIYHHEDGHDIRTHDLFPFDLIMVMIDDWEVVPETKKLFISQPMNGKSDAEILSVRMDAIAKAVEITGDDVEVIDSFFQNAPTDAKPLWYLGESLKLLAEADVAYFADGWAVARGCKIEHDCATAYGIKIIHD